MLDTVLKDRHGRDIEIAKGEPATVRISLFTALDTALDGDERMTSAEKLKLYRLGVKLAEREVDLSAAEVTLLLERANKAFPTAIIYGQLVAALDPVALKA